MWRRRRRGRCSPRGWRGARCPSQSWRAPHSGRLACRRLRGDRSVRSCVVVAAFASVLAVVAASGTALAAVPVDWPTFGFDVRRDGVNPSESALDRASVTTLVQRWATPISPAGWSVSTQPVVATGVSLGLLHTADLVLVGTEGGALTAVDLHTRQEGWRRVLPTSKPAPG